MSVNATLNIGDLLTLLGMLIVLVTFGSNLKSSLQHVEARINALENKFDKVENKLEAINLVLIELAKYDGRLALVEQRLNFAIALRESANSNAVKTIAEGR